MELQDGEVIPKGNTTYSEGDALPYNEMTPVTTTEEVPDNIKRNRYYNELFNVVKDSPEIAKFNIKPKADTDTVSDDEIAGLQYLFADVYNKDKYQKGKLVGIPYKTLNVAGDSSPFASINYKLGDQIENTLVENKNKETLTEYNTEVTKLNDPSLTIANSIAEIDPKKLSYVQYKKQRQSIPELPDVASPEDITPEHMAKLQVAMAAKTHNSLFEQVKDNPEVIALGYKLKKYDDVVSPKEEEFLEETLKNKLNKEYADKAKSLGMKFTPVDKLWDFNSGITDRIDNAINKKNEDEWLANTNKLAKQYGIAPFKSVEDYDQTHVAKWDAYNTKQLNKNNSTIAELNKKLPEKERFPIVKTNEEYQFIFPKLKAAAAKVQAAEVKKFEAKQVKEASSYVDKYNLATNSNYTLPKTKGEAKLVLEKIKKDIKYKKSLEWTTETIPYEVTVAENKNGFYAESGRGNSVVVPKEMATKETRQLAAKKYQESLIQKVQKLQGALNKTPEGKIVFENLQALDNRFAPAIPQSKNLDKVVKTGQVYTVTASDVPSVKTAPSAKEMATIAKDDKLRSKQYSDILQKQYNDVNIAFEALNKNAQNFKISSDALKEKINKEGYTKENKSALNALDEQQKILMSQNDVLSEMGTLNKIYAGNIFESKAKVGTFAGASWNNLLTGGGEVLNGIYDLSETLGFGGMMSLPATPELNDKLKKERVLAVKKDIANLLDKAKANVSDEYMQKKSEDGSVAGVLMQLPRTIPAMAIAIAQPEIGFAMFALQDYGTRLPDAINNPKNANLTFNQLVATTLPISIVNGVIEDISMKSLGKSMEFLSLTKKLGSEIAAKELLSAKVYSNFLQEGVDATGLTKYVSTKAIKVAGVLLEQANTEAFENLMQEIATNINNSIANKVLKTDSFQVNNDANAYWNSLKSGWIGGLAFGSIATAGYTIANDIKVESINNKQFELIRYALQDPAIMKSWVTDIKLKIANKEITLDEGKEYLASVKEFGYIASKIPTDISVANQKKAFDLIKERMAIEQEVKGKDESLTLAKKQRITEINKQLQAISLETVAAADNGQVVTANAEAALADIEAKKADVEKRRQEELGVVSSAIAASERTGEVPAVNGELVSKKTIEEINAKHDAELSTLETQKQEIINNQKNTQGNATTQKQQQQQEGTAKDNLGQREGAVQGQQEDGQGKGEQRSAKDKGADNSYSNQPSEKQKVAELRAAEQKELDEKIPNAEQYRVNGKVDRTKLTNDTDRKAFDEVYSKYDKLISPLLEGAKPKTVFDSLPVGIKASEGQPTRMSHAPLFTAAKTALKTLNEIFPDLEIHFHENSDDFQKVLDATAGGRKASTADGNFSYIKDKDGNYTVRIDINLSHPNASVTTVIHEATHPILLSEFGDNPKYFEYLKNQVSKSVGFTKNIKLKKFIKAYEDEQQPEEYLVQLGAILKDNEKIEPNVFRRIAEAINKIVLRITKGKFKPFEDVKNSNETVRYFSSLVEAVRTGDLSKTKLRSQSQKAGAPMMGSKQSRGGLTATDMKSMTVADNGDLLFFHYGDIKGSKVDARKGTPKAYTTDKRVYTANYYYTNESDREGMVGGKVNVVRVPADKVYNFNKDVLGLFDEAKKNSEAHSKGQAFSPNRQADFIAQLAAKNGFDMVVAKWGNGYRAESPKALSVDAALTKQMRTNGSLSTAAVDDKLNQDIYNAAASKANGNSEKYRSAFYGIKDITAKDIMEHPILSRGIPKKLADKYNGGQVRSKQSRSNNEDIVSASVNVAPLYSTKVSNVGQAELIHNSELYKRYKKNNERLAKMFNLKVISQGDGVGGYEFSNGDAVMEATTVVNVRGKFSDIVNYAAVVGALAPEVQDATIAGMHVDENDENHNADRIAIGVDNVDAAMKAAEASGFDRDGFTLIGNEISFFDVFFDPKGSKKQKEKTKDFKNKISTFANKYTEYGGKINAQSTSAVRSEYIDNVRRREIINEIRSSGIQYGYDRSGLRDALAKAEERNTRYTSWKYLDKSETAKEYRNLRQLQFDAAANGTSITDTQRKRISELEKRMSKILSTTFKSDANEYEKAKLEVYAIANDVAGLVEDGYKSEFPIKRPSRAAVKTVRWYSSQPNLLGDGARANVVVNTDTDADFLYDGLLTRFPSPTERNEKAKTELGYPKRLIEIKTSNGKLAEIQVMTTQGYLAKDGVKYFPEDAKSKAADSLKEVRGRLGWKIPDGIGHYFYEIHRDPNVSKSLRDEAEVVSNKYYDAFLNKDSKLTDAEFRADVQAFKDNVDKANKSNWDEGNTGESPKELDTYLASEGNEVKSKQSVTAFHGSQYNFDKFTTDKIGTGEGMQAFGWGLYFTDLKSIAENYAKKLSTESFYYDGKPISDAANNYLFLAEDSFSDVDFDGKRIKELAPIAIDKIKNEYIPDFKDIQKTSFSQKQREEMSAKIKEAQDAIKELEDIIKSKEITSVVNKKLYEVTLHEGKTPEQYTWLEWDKPLTDSQLNKISEQANKEDVNINKDLIKKNNPLSKDIYREIGTMISQNKGIKFSQSISFLNAAMKEASLFMLRAGIDGIKYPAESISRGATSDTARGFNYVVFDENAVTIKSKQSRVSDILNDTFNQEAKKTKIDKLDVKALARKVVDIVKSSKLYTQTDDIERENAIIDFLKSKGIVQKRVIEPRNKNIISVNEVTALKDQIRLEIKAANDGAKSIEDAIEKIGEIIKGLAKGKKISVTSAKALINKFSNMNTANKDSVKNVLDYAEKIFNDAEYADKVSQVRALNALMRRAASNNAIPPATRSIALSFAKINPEAVSDIDAHLEAAKKIKDALVGVKENGVKIRKSIDINAMADYLKTAMTEQDTYDAKNPTTTRVVEPLDEEKALEYLTAEHDSLLQAAKALVPSAVLTDAEMAQLKNFLKLSIDDFETMEDKIAAVEALDNFVKNADMGKIPFILNNQQVNANINRGVKAIMPKLSSMSLMWFSENKAKIRGWFDNKTWYRDSPKDFSKTLAYFMNQSIRRVDNLIGNFKNYDVFNNTFKSLASGYAKYLFKINSMDADVIFQKVLASFRGDMYKAVQHCYKMTMYKLQLEYESNIGNKEVIPAMKHLEKTLESGNLTKKDKAELRRLIEEFSTEDPDTGEKKIDTEKIWNSFNKVEQKAAEMLSDYYAKLTPYAKHVAVSLRGVPFNPRVNYTMLNVINQQASSSAMPPSTSQVFTKGTTKAGTIIERDGKAHPISLDPYSTFNAANRDVMMDYCLLNPIKTVEAIFKKLVEDTANDEKANDVAKSLEFIFNEITESIINRSFVMSDKVWTDVLNYIKKVGARYMLAKIDKAPAEFAGNAIFAGIGYTENILEGIKNNAYQRSFELSQAMEVLNSYSIDRLYPHKGQSGAFLDPNSFDIDVRDKKHFIDGASNVAQIAYYNSLLQAQKGGEAVSDFLVTAPDLAVGRMAWEGTLRLEFKKETGTEIDLEKVIKKDYDYLEKYKDALEKATTEADRVIVDIASSKNPFVGMAKESVRRDYNSFMTSIDGFLRSFSKNENQVGMDALYALVKSGKIDRARGIRLLAAILARGGVYNSVRAKVLLLLTGLGFAIVNGITGGDDSEEKRRRRARLQLEYMNVEGDDWAEKSPVVAGKKILYAGNIYEVVTGGITSANPPSDTSGKVITDGTAKYKWVGTIPRIQGSITGIKDNVSMGNSLRTYDKQFIEKAKKAAAPEETMAHSFNKGAAQSAVGIILGRNSGAIFSNLFMAPAVEYANEKFIHPAISSDPYDKYRDGIMYSKMIDRNRKDPELNFIIDNTGVFNPFFKAAVTGYRMFDNKYGDRLRELNKKIEDHEKGVKVPREESSKEKYYGFIAERDALLEKQKPVKAMMAKNIIIAAFTVTGVLPSGKTIDVIADKTLQDKILSPSDMDNIIKNIENARNYSGGGSVRLENPKENDKVLVYPDIYTDYTLQGRKIPAKKP